MKRHVTTDREENERDFHRKKTKDWMNKRLIRNRDIVVVTGPNAVGKTKATSYLRDWSRTMGLPYEEKAVTDSQSMLVALQQDDEIGGFNHTHEWCNQDKKGHSHHVGEPILPFTVVGNEIPNNMFHYFFNTLSHLPRTGKIWFVEWAGGVNTNPPEEPTSIVDYSYKKVRKFLEEGFLPKAWVERVLTILHPIADYSVRVLLNQDRYAIPSPEEIEKGTRSWAKDETILRMFGQDDFFEIEDLLRKSGISNIRSIRNDGTDSYIKLLEKEAIEMLDY